MKRIPPRYRVGRYWCRICRAARDKMRCHICGRVCVHNFYFFARRYYEYPDLISPPGLTRRQYRKRIELKPYHFASRKKG